MVDLSLSNSTAYERYMSAMKANDTVIDMINKETYNPYEKHNLEVVFAKKMHPVIG